MEEKLYVIASLSGFDITNDPADKKTTAVPNCRSGLEMICSRAKIQTPIVFVGNRRWSTLMAINLIQRGFTHVLYAPFSQTKSKKGKAGTLKQQLAAFIENGQLLAVPFRALMPKESVPDPHGVLLVKNYMITLEKVHREKHHVMDLLYFIFPEAIFPGKDAPESESKKLPSLWEPEMRALLENPDLKYWKNSENRNTRMEKLEFFFKKDKRQGSKMQDRVRQRLHALNVRLELLANDSLANGLSAEYLKANILHYHRQYALLLSAEIAKRSAMEEIKNFVGDHPALAEFGKTDEYRDTIRTVIALLIHKKWEHWRVLRSHAGLAVNRRDAQFPDKMRIARTNQLLTTRLYLLFQTAKGKEIIEKIPKTKILNEKEVFVRNRKVKQLEKLLKYLWKTYL